MYLDDRLADCDTAGHKACLKGYPPVPPRSLTDRERHAWMEGWHACDSTPRLAEDLEMLLFSREQCAEEWTAYRENRPCGV